MKTTRIDDGRQVFWGPNAGPQTAFLASPAREVLYGGAAAGGKTDAIIAGALRYADHPAHRAILFRRTRPQLQEVIDRTKELYPEVVPGAYWIERENRWYLPAGGYIQMGYAEHEEDILAFKTFEYNYIGFDELTSFTQKMYTFMFSRNRSKSRDLPLMMRGASNPGDIGHEWVYDRFLRNRVPFRIYEEKETVAVGGQNIDVSFTRQFIPAKVTDNPKLPDAAGYIAGLLQMGEEGQMYLHGVWTRLTGTMFKKVPQEVPAKLLQKHYYIVMCMDYGLNDPTAVHWLVVYDDNTVDIAGELYVNEVSVDEVARQIKLYERDVLKMRAPIIRVGDPKMFARDPTSMQSVGSMLTDNGITVVKANNDRVAGWVQIQRFAWRNQLRVWSGRAPHLMRTMPNLMRDPKKPNDIKQGQEDHAVDSIRYGVMAIYDRLPEATRPDDAQDDPNEMDMEYDKLVNELIKRNGTEYFDQLGWN